jgi:hypothetical protein
MCLIAVLMSQTDPCYGGEYCDAPLLQAILEGHDLPKLLITAIESVNAADTGQAMNMFFRLLLADDNRRTERFVHQFISVWYLLSQRCFRNGTRPVEHNSHHSCDVQAGGMQSTFLQKLLRESNPSLVLIKTLLIISQMARIARVGSTTLSGNYELIHRADIYQALRRLFTHTDAGVRMRLCSLVGTHLFIVQCG